MKNVRKSAKERKTGETKIVFSKQNRESQPGPDKVKKIRTLNHNKNET